MPLDPKQQPPYYTPGTIPPGPTIQPKLYKAIIHQTSSNSAITTNVLINTLGTVNINRTGEGLYSIASTGLFPLNKTLILPNGSGGQLAIPISQPSPTMFNYIMSYEHSTENLITLYIQSSVSPFTFIDIYDIQPALHLIINLEIYQ